MYIFKKLITKKVCVLCVYEKFSKGTGGNRGTIILLCWRLYSDNLFCNETAFYIKVFQVHLPMLIVSILFYRLEQLLPPSFSLVSPTVYLLSYISIFFLDIANCSYYFF